MSDLWETPRGVYADICNQLGFAPNIDAFANAENTKCRYYITATQNAFITSWQQLAKDLGVPPIFWMNPPYSQPNITLAIKKAIEESNNGCTTMFLLPSFVDQSWYHDLIKPHRHYFWRGRIKFVPPQGIKQASPRYGNIYGVIEP